MGTTEGYQVKAEPADAAAMESYNQNMINTAENPEGTGEGEATEDKLLAGKYKTQDELEKGILELAKKQHGDDLESFYKSLESGLGKDDQTKEGTKETENESENEKESDSKEIPDNAEKEEAEEALEQKGLDMQKFEAEFLEKGELGEESYKELEKAGIPKELVDSFIEGQKAKADQFNKQFFELAGSEESYKEMVNWAAENWTDDRKESFNKAIQSGNWTDIQLQVNDLKTQFSKNNSNPPKEMKHGDSSANANASGDTYNSMAEVSEDMAKPEYKTSEQFRNYVMNKVKRSKNL